MKKYLKKILITLIIMLLSINFDYGAASYSIKLKANAAEEWSVNLSSDGNVKATYYVKNNGERNELIISGTGGKIEYNKWKEMARKFDRNNFNSYLSGWKGTEDFDIKFDGSVKLCNSGQKGGLFQRFDGAIYFGDSIDTSEVTDMSHMFQSTQTFNQPLGNNFNTSQVTNMYSMFSGAKAFNQSVASFDTSNVGNMLCMFYEASAFNQPVSNFNTSQVTNMQEIFSRASSFNQSVSHFDMSKVSNISSMFSGASSIKNIDLSNKETTNIPDSRNLLYGTTPDTVKFKNLAHFIWTVPMNYEVKKNDVKINDAVKGETIEFERGATYVLKVKKPTFELSNATGENVVGEYDENKKELIIKGDGTIIYDKWKNMAQSFNNKNFFSTNSGWFGKEDFNIKFDGNVKLCNTGEQGGLFQKFDGDILFNNSVDTSEVRNMSRMFEYAKAFNHSLDDFNTSQVTDMSHMFYGASSFNSSLGDNFDTSQVTDMSNMFDKASSFNQSLGGKFNTSQVTDMSYMFYGASAFNQSLDGFDTLQVTNMSHMFNGASAFNQPLDGFNTSQVTNMSFMFNNATSFNGTLSGNFDTSQVINMTSMFNGASSFNRALDNFNTSKVTDMEYMFAGASSFNQQLTNFDTSQVQYMNSMFDRASAFNQSLSSFDTSNVKSMQCMFYKASTFNQPVSNFNTSKVTNMQQMFEGASAFNQSVSNFDISEVNDISGMFSGASSIKNIDLSNKNTDTGLDCSRLLDSVNPNSVKFQKLPSFTWKAPMDYEVKKDDVKQINILKKGQSITFDAGAKYELTVKYPTFELSNAIGENVVGEYNEIEKKLIIKGNGTIIYDKWKEMAKKFGDSNFDSSGWTGEEDFDIKFDGKVVLEDAGDEGGLFENFDGDIYFNNKVDTSNMTNMSHMFAGAKNFNQPLGEKFNTENVTDMLSMFEGASKFNQSLNNFNTSKVKSMANMFKGASKFNGTLGGSFNTSSVERMNGMFRAASSFNQSLSNFDTLNVKNMSDMFRDAKVFNQPLNSFNTSNVTSMNNMFMRANSFNQSVSNFDTSNVTYMENMFRDAKAFNQPVNSFDISKVSRMKNMFNGASSMESINLSNKNSDTEVDCSNLLESVSSQSIKFKNLGDFSWTVPDGYWISVDGGEFTQRSGSYVFEKGHEYKIFKDKPVENNGIVSGTDTGSSGDIVVPQITDQVIVHKQTSPPPSSYEIINNKHKKEEKEKLKEDKLKEEKLKKADTDLYYDSVKFLLDDKKVIKASDDKYRISDKVTRALGLSYMYDIDIGIVHGLYKGLRTMLLSSKMEHKIHEESIDWGYKIGVTKGNGDGFAPRELITRQDIITMLYRHAKKYGKLGKYESKINNFEDAKGVSSYALEAIDWAVSRGLIQSEDNKINPKQTITRDEVIKILTRFYNTK